MKFEGALAFTPHGALVLPKTSAKPKLDECRTCSRPESGYKGPLPAQTRYGLGRPLLTRGLA